MHDVESINRIIGSVVKCKCKLFFVRSFSYLSYSIVFVFLLMIFSGESMAEVTNCGKDFSCLHNFSDEAIRKLGDDINWWSNLHALALIAVVICGVVTTLVIGIQGDGNKFWTRPVGLISTSVGAAIVTLVGAFHVQDNVDKLIEVRTGVTLAFNKLKHDLAQKNDDNFEVLYYEYSKEFVRYMDGLAKLKGSAGRMNIKEVNAGTNH